MKILCFIDNLGSGGAQRQLTMIGVLLKKKGHDVTFLTYHESDFFGETLKDNGIEHDCLRCSDPIERVRRVRSVLRSGDQDVVLSYLDTPNFLAELSAIPNRKWGLVVSERSTDSGAAISWKKRLMRRMHTLADWVVTNSVANRRILESRFPYLAGKVKTIYNAVDLEFFSPSECYSPRATGCTRLVVAASHQYNKNLSGLINAAAELEPELRSRLIIDWYGDVVEHARSPYDEALALISEHGLESILHLYPATACIREKMQMADFVGLLSYREGLPNAICEAMSCGKPIIMSEVSDASTLVEPGLNGFLCDPKDSGSIASALRRALSAGNEDLVRMGEVSRRRAVTMFDPETTVGEYDNLIRAAVSRA